MVLSFLCMFQHFLKSFIGISLFFLVLFLAAGRIDYVEGWIYFALSVFGLMLNVILIKDKQDLLNERSRPGANTKPWDKKILGLSAFLSLVAYVVAGLDAGRFHWSSPFDWPLTVIGILLTMIGQVVFAVAKYQNNFFSSVARIQTERNHGVVDRGLYRIVRHPGYGGMILSWISFPLVLHSLYSIIPAVVAIILLIIRTSLEDRMLISELNGYSEYSQKTVYRLVPLVW